MKKHDNIYAKALNKVDDFKFDESVVDVFPDMIQRSVPGYETIVHTIGELAKIAVTPNTVIYDLGCSLGAASLSVARALPNDTCEIIGVDASANGRTLQTRRTDLHTAKPNCYSAWVCTKCRN